MQVKKFSLAAFGLQIFSPISLTVPFIMTKKFGTHAGVFSQTLAHEKSKN